MLRLMHDAKVIRCNGQGACCHTTANVMSCSQRCRLTSPATACSGGKHLLQHIALMPCLRNVSSMSPFPETTRKPMTAPTHTHHPTCMRLVPGAQAAGHGGQGGC